MSAWVHLLLTSSLLAVLSAGGCSRPEPPPSQNFEEAAQESAGSNAVAQPEAVIAVEGMVCQGCANAAAEVASQVPGVISARGVFEDGTVVVRYRSEVTSSGGIAEAITAADRGEAPAFTAHVASP